MKVISNILFLGSATVLGGILRMEGDGSAISFEGTTCSDTLTCEDVKALKDGGIQGVQLPQSAGAPVECTPLRKGFMYFDTELEVFKGCNGRMFTNLSQSARSCSEITGPSGIYNVFIGGKETEVYCENSSYGGGWTQLMRASGTEWGYSSDLWTTANTLNVDQVQPQFNNNAKFSAFNTLPVQEIFIKSEFGNSVHLKLPQQKTLLELFQGGCTTLERIDGAEHPLKLIDGRDTTMCTPSWRVNTKGNYDAMIRLGGWAHVHWNCNYGADGCGHNTGAHLLGFGLYDGQWQPFTANEKSFGIRDAHDANYLGQTASSAIIFGR